MSMVAFLNGAAAMGCAFAGLFFLRFWRWSRDWLFLAFAIAFACFSVNYAALGLVPVADETQPYLFVLRLIGFVAILAGVIRRNWRAGPGRQRG